MSKKSLEFHIKSDDYFASLATVLSFVNQVPENIGNNTKCLNSVIKDLMFLQKEFKIVKKFAWSVTIKKVIKESRSKT